jgi:2-polyprenyl-6-methoxyphenol hydroxylase-like FAD-dependent oxidoreductase
MTDHTFEASTLPAQTDVLIVGAGPTGLALAIALQQAGIDHVLVDKLPAGLNTSRAGVIHAHTLEMLEALGVSEELTKRGLKITDFCIRERDRVLLRLRFNQIPSAYPYVLMLPQDQTERILSERLASLGGSIHRNVAATAAVQESGYARLSLTTPLGDTTVRAKYVIGADGMHSIIRTAAGVSFDGGTYDESFVLADVRMDWAFNTSEVTLFFSPAGLVVVAPLPGGTFRVVATVDEAPERLTREDIQRLMDARGPSFGVKSVTEVLWSSRFRIHHRVAHSYRQGPFFLMGDAAHVHSPAGGQGMNTGIVDAVVLGQLLTRAIRGGSDAVLEAYHELRQPAAKEVLALAGRLTSFATVRGFPKRLVRNAVLSLISVVPPVQRQIVMNLSGLSRKAFSIVPAQPLPEFFNDSGRICHAGSEESTRSVTLYR